MYIHSVFRPALQIHCKHIAKYIVPRSLRWHSLMATNPNPDRARRAATVPYMLKTMDALFKYTEMQLRTNPNM